jgi:hypothetical protein
VNRTIKEALNSVPQANDLIALCHVNLERPGATLIEQQ